MMNRDNTLDISKAIGMILVVLGHTNFSFGQVIYQFHLPLFFFLSGIVFNEKKINDYKAFICGKIKRLYIPFICFEFIFLALHNLFWNIGFYSEMSSTPFLYSMKDYVIMTIKILTMGGGEQLAGPLWFLISSLEIVIIFSLLYIVLKRLRLNHQKLVCFLMCLLLYFVGCYTDLPRMGSQSLIGLFFFCCGYLYKHYKEKIPFNGFYLVVAAGVVLCSYVINTVDISELQITYKPVLIFSGLAGTYFVLGISRGGVFRRENSIITRFMIYAGRNTLFILALHCISFKLISIIQCVVYNLDWTMVGCFPTFEVKWYWCIPYTLAGVVLPVCVKKLIDNAMSYVRGFINEKKVH